MNPFFAARPNGHVLAVDDCPTTRELLRASLEHFGYAVQAVDSGWAALEAVAQADFDAVILDVEMPGLDGMAVGRALRSTARMAGAVIAMHSSLEESAVRAGFSQYDAFLTKPVSPLDLGAQVDRLVRKRRGAGAAPGLAGHIPA
jgi:two-component system sensor histidine kinase BarA